MTSALNVTRKHHVYLNIYNIGSGALIKSNDERVETDVFTTSTTPTYSTLLTLDFDKTIDSSLLNLIFTGTWTHTGTGGITQGAIFRFTIDGVAVTGGSTGSTTTDLLHTSRLFTRVSGISTGTHTINLEWARTTVSAQTLRINVGTSPTLYHAEIIVREES